MKDSFREVGLNLILWEAIPFMKNVDPKFKKVKNGVLELIEVLKKKYQSHYKDYDETVIRDCHHSEE